MKLWELDKTKKYTFFGITGYFIEWSKSGANHDREWFLHSTYHNKKPCKLTEYYSWGRLLEMEWYEVKEKPPVEETPKPRLMAYRSGKLVQFFSETPEYGDVIREPMVRDERFDIL